jgi:hypothetical protein
MTGGDLYKARQVLYQKLLLPQLSSPFLLISFSGMYKDTSDNKTDTQYTKNCPNKGRKPFKEIACQADGKYSFTQITYEFSNKFSSRLVNDIHNLNLSQDMIKVKENRTRNQLQISDIKIGAS